MGGSNAQIRQRYIRIPGSVDEAFLMIDYENGGAERWAYPDERGSIVATAHSNGFVAELFQYDEYGRMTGNVGASYPFRYTGQRWDNNIGMYYYKARHYDPQMGRFLQPDPIGYGDGLNMYGYVGGDPVNFTDPTGLFLGGLFEGIGNAFRSFAGGIGDFFSGGFGDDGGGGGGRRCEGLGCDNEVTTTRNPLFGSGPSGIPVFLSFGSGTNSSNNTDFSVGEDEQRFNTCPSAARRRGPLFACFGPRCEGDFATEEAAIRSLARQIHNEETSRFINTARPPAAGPAPFERRFGFVIQRFDGRFSTTRLRNLGGTVAGKAPTSATTFVVGTGAFSVLGRGNRRQPPPSRSDFQILDFSGLQRGFLVTHNIDDFGELSGGFAITEFCR